jgi:hypothetical protein
MTEALGRGEREEEKSASAGRRWDHRIPRMLRSAGRLFFINAKGQRRRSSIKHKQERRRQNGAHNIENAEKQKIPWMRPEMTELKKGSPSMFTRDF